jgi:hypothetical protein
MRGVRAIGGCLAGVVLAVSLFACTRHTQITPWVVPAEVPEAYRPLYRELDVLLHRKLPLFPPLPGLGRPAGPAFGLELPFALPGPGEAAAPAGDPAPAILALERFQALAVRRVAITVPYPLLTAADPRTPAARRRLEHLAAEIRGRGFALAVRVAADPAGERPAVGVAAERRGAERRRLNAGLRDMSAAIIAGLRPDWLTVAAGPGAFARATGLPVTPQDFRDSVRHVVGELAHPGVRLGAGAGSWEAVDFIQELAGIAELDFVDLSLRPVQHGFVHERVSQAAGHARRAGKGVVFGEAWLAKSSGREFGVIPPLAALARDGYAFWQPLDEHFIELITMLAREVGAELAVFSGTEALFGALEYSEAAAALPPAELRARARRAAVEGLRQKTMTPTAAFLRAKIGG